MATTASSGIALDKGKGREGTDGDADLVAPPPPTQSEGRTRDLIDSSAFPQTHYEIIAFLRGAPRYKLTLEALLHYRTLAQQAGHLSSPDVTMVLASLLLSGGFDNPALRLLSETASLHLHAPDAPSPPSTLVMAKLIELYERPLRQITRRTRTPISWPFVVQMTQAALSRGLVSPLILSIRMRALQACKRHVDVISTFDLFASHGFEPAGGDYDEVVLAHLLNLELEPAQARLAEKAAKGLPTSSQTCIALMEGMAPFGGNRIMEEKVLGEVDEAALAAREAIRQDVRVLNKMLSVRAARGNLDDALALLSYYDFSDFPPDLIDKIAALAPNLLPARFAPSPPPSSLDEPFDPSFDTLADSDPYASFDPSLPPLPPSPAHFWRPRPDLATMVSLVSIVLRESRPDLALSLLSTAHRLEMGFNSHLAVSMVHVFLSLHDVDSAEEFVYSLQAGTATFAGLPCPALPRVSSAVYEQLFGGILRYRGLKGANDSLSRLLETQQISVPVTEGMTRALVHHLSLEAEKDASVSADLLVKVQRLTHGRVRATAEHLNTLLRAAWQKERTKKRNTRIEEEYPIPDESELAPPPRAQARHDPPKPRPEELLPAEAELLGPSSSSSSARPSSLARIRDSLADRHIRPLRSTSRHVLRNDHLLRFIPAKWAYLQSQVLDLGIRPTYHHLTVLLRAYLVLGDAKGAHRALDYGLKELGLEPHVALYSTLIAGLARLGDHVGAQAVYQAMTGRGIKPDRTLFAALAMSHARRRDLAGVERVLDDVRRLARERAPHPQLLAHAHSQALRSASARFGTGAGVPGALLTPYDPLLDPVFVTIYYRALVVSGELERAQTMLRDSLARGLVPDQVLLITLRRSIHWLARKRNNASASASSSAPRLPRAPGDRTQTTELGAGSVKHGSSGARLSLDELEALRILAMDNIAAVLHARRGVKHTLTRKELRDLMAYWKKAEKGLLPPPPKGRGRDADVGDDPWEDLEGDLDQELGRIERSLDGPEK
ncbi:hypothetical protein JCM10207_008486 [Rhodosporidiobolus poonsookiae]